METTIVNILEGELTQKATNYSIAQIWEKRPWLTGNTNYEEQANTIVNTTINDDTAVGEIIEHTGIDSPAVEIKPMPVTYQNVEMAHIYWTEIITVHDVNDLIYKYNAQLNGMTSLPPEKAYKTIVNGVTTIYDKIVNKYIYACEKGLAQALSNPAGWVIPAKENQEPKTYNPNITNNSTGALTDFDTNDPALKLLYDIVNPAYAKGYNPNIILIGDAIAHNILTSAFYNSKGRPQPIPTNFSYTPKESKNEIVAKGALELTGCMAGSCKVIWITSKINGDSVFNANTAVATRLNDIGTIYSGPTTTMDNGVVNSIVRFNKAPIINEKELRFFAEYSYLPIVNNPNSIFRCIYS